MATTRVRARRTDPATSHLAAKSVREITISKVKAAILKILERGPLTDEELADKFHAVHLYWKWYSPSGLRTRRRELADLGFIEDSGERGVTVAGRETIKWRLRVTAVVAGPEDVLQTDLPF